MVDIIGQVSKQVNIKSGQVQRVIDLIKKDGNTIPFVARYRKNETGNLSEEDLDSIVNEWDYLNNLEQRKQEIKETLETRDVLTPELENAVAAAKTQQELLEIYKPYKQKKKTRKMKAEERGLGPLAAKLIKGQICSTDELQQEIANYISDEEGVSAEDEVLQGAKDIIAEKLVEKPENRSIARGLCERETFISVKKKDKAIDDNKVYQDYYEYDEGFSKVPYHRFMAINRGERENVLKVKFLSPGEKIIDKIKEKESVYLKGTSKEIIESAITDGCKRLLIPSIERELRATKLEKAEERAISIFSKNLENLLMQSPIKGKVIMGIDPAYKSGCKVAIIDSRGDLLETGVIYPTSPHNQWKKAETTLLDMIETYKVEIIAIGNGTASRETEEFVAGVITSRSDTEDVHYAIISEDGASVYSASKLAREEFPELDVQERSAISIARRVLDPLAELVKIDPKSLGVGQYQHDLSQKKLDKALFFVVEKVVNQVGVDVNTASLYLLKNISGLNKNTAANIVKKRSEIGGFESRKKLKSVKGLGEKTFEQSAGFLRVVNGKTPLDKTSIHPESYSIAKEFLDFMGMDQDTIGLAELKSKTGELLDEIGRDSDKGQKLSRKFNCDIYTLMDILKALNKPQHDPREKFDKPRLKKDILKLEDLKEGMVLEGEIKNVVDFGAFVDLGIKENGLIHISNLSDKFIKHPLEVVGIGYVVTVEIISLDKDRGRIGLRKV